MRNKPISNIKKIAAISLGFFFISNIISVLPTFNGVNLELLSLVLPLIYVIVKIVSRQNLRMPIKFLLFFILLTVPSILMAKDIDTEKYLKIVGYVIYFSIVVPNLIESEQELILFLKTIAYGGLVISIITILTPITLTTNARIQLFGSNPIWLSRSVVFSLYWFILIYINNKINVLLFLMISIPVLYVMVMTAAKGPMLAIVIALTILFCNKITVRHILRRNIIRNTLLLILLIPVVILAIKNTPKQISDRFLLFLKNPSSEEARVSLILISLKLIFFNPIGIGSGNFIEYSSFKYPHNFILEAFVEYGWGFGLFISHALIKMLRYLIKILKKGIIYEALMGFITISFVNSLLSGDMTSAKEVYFGLAYYYSQKKCAVIKI